MRAILTAPSPAMNRHTLSHLRRSARPVRVPAGLAAMSRQRGVAAIDAI
jgi:hypothetical protein